MSSEWATFYLLVFVGLRICDHLALDAYGIWSLREQKRRPSSRWRANWPLRIVTGSAIHSYARHERISRIEK